jgi:hypothetical protein
MLNRTLRDSRYRFEMQECRRRGIRRKKGIVGRHHHSHELLAGFSLLRMHFDVSWNVYHKRLNTRGGVSAVGNELEDVLPNKRDIGQWTKCSVSATP